MPNVRAGRFTIDIKIAKYFGLQFFVTNDNIIGLNKISENTENRM